MVRFDSRHTAFHVLIGLYFIWLAVYTALIGMTLVNTFGDTNPALNRLFMIWIFFNVLMGTALFLVIRLFGSSNALLSNVILYSYSVLALLSIAVVLLVTYSV